MNQRLYKLDNKAKENIRSAIKEILKTRMEVEFAYLYGSFLEQRGFHDIDVAVFINEKEMPKDLLEFELSLSSILESIVRLPMDVKVLNHAPVGFRYEVTCGEAIFSRDEETRFRFIEKTWIEYLDYKPVAESILRELVA